MEHLSQDVSLSQGPPLSPCLAWPTHKRANHSAPQGMGRMGGGEKVVECVVGMSLMRCREASLYNNNEQTNTLGNIIV